MAVELPHLICLLGAAAFIGVGLLVLSLSSYSYDKYGDETASGCGIFGLLFLLLGILLAIAVLF
jgi:hypothetical protein